METNGNRRTSESEPNWPIINKRIGITTSSVIADADLICLLIRAAASIVTFFDNVVASSGYIVEAIKPIA